MGDIKMVTPKQRLQKIISEMVKSELKEAYSQKAPVQYDKVKNKILKSTKGHVTPLVVVQGKFCFLAFGLSESERSLSIKFLEENNWTVDDTDKLYINSVYATHEIE